MFTGRFTPTIVTLVTAEGEKEHTKMVGTLRVTVHDNSGTPFTYDIPGVVYDKDSPHSLLGVPFLAKYFAKEGEGRD